MKIKTHPYFEILTKNNLCPFCQIKFPLHYRSKDTNCKTCDFHRVISQDVGKIAFNVRRSTVTECTPLITEIVSVIGEIFLFIFTLIYQITK